MKRRNMLLAGTAAAAAGAGTALWRWGAEGDAAARQQARATSVPSINSMADVWQLSFATLSDASIPLASFKGKPLTINFWATWCAPCIQEIPLLDAFFKTHQSQGWNVLGLALDNPPAVKTFLARKPVSYPIALVGLHGLELIKFLGNTEGGLPFSVMLNQQGDIIQRKLGALHEADLREWSTLKHQST
jgi:thiol-disulfide isomerase/thioredoxin